MSSVWSSSACSPRFARSDERLPRSRDVTKELPHVGYVTNSPDRRRSDGTKDTVVLVSAMDARQGISTFRRMRTQSHAASQHTCGLVRFVGRAEEPVSVGVDRSTFKNGPKPNSVRSRCHSCQLKQPVFLQLRRQSSQRSISAAMRQFATARSV